jgi:MOSC domain-containing protein YiiM
MRNEMTVVSVNVGTPREILVKDGVVLTSIFKSPVAGRVAVTGNNIAGDVQADMSVHGGPHKAVYCYPEEHYGYWREQLPFVTLVAGMFGENLTTRGLDEEEVSIGDRFRVGSALLQVTQPRMPCFKLGIRFGRADIVKKFWRSGRPGIYFSIIEAGDVAAGDPIALVQPAADRISVADVVALYQGKKRSADLMDRALRAPLFGGWKDGLRTRRGR